MTPSDPPAALELDIRPLCAAQRPPLPAILDAVGKLAPGQPFRLIAPFEPAPLYQLLGQQGFTHEAHTRDDGTWEIVFSRD
ncbi:MAG: DUF2249 domain-containing protein [Verrucomicrobiota bacterium]